jgi:hypothetical protein
LNVAEKRKEKCKKLQIEITGFCLRHQAAVQVRPTNEHSEQHRHLDQQALSLFLLSISFFSFSLILISSFSIFFLFHLPFFFLSLLSRYLSLSSI